MSSNDDIKDLTKKVDLFPRLLKIEAMLEVSITMQAQIISKLENRDFNEVVKKAFDNVDETVRDIFRSLPDAH